MLSRLGVALDLYIYDPVLTSCAACRFPSKQLRTSDARSPPQPRAFQLTELKRPFLYRSKEQQRLIYACAIALQLSPLLKLPALEIATALAQLVRQQTDEQDFLVQVMPSGLIHLELTEPSLAAWLQRLIQAPPLFKAREDLGDLEQRSRGENYELTPTPLFPIQYAHARCCSLMQLAHSEGLLTLKQIDADTSAALWLVVAPNPIPWLNLEQKLYLSHPTERALIAQLLALLDDLNCYFPSPKVVDWHKAGANLSQAFQSFYSHCRIWGEVKNQNLQLAQARLGLVLISQLVLRLLLQERLSAIAPLEL